MRTFLGLPSYTGKPSEQCNDALNKTIQSALYPFGMLETVCSHDIPVLASHTNGTGESKHQPALQSLQLNCTDESSYCHEKIDIS